MEIEMRSKSIRREFLNGAPAARKTQAHGAPAAEKKTQADDTPAAEKKTQAHGAPAAVKKTQTDGAPAGTHPAARERGLAQLVRICTAPPLMALCLLLGLRGAGYFPGASLAPAILFLTVLPVLAYPVWFLVPALRKGAFGTGQTVCAGVRVEVPALMSDWRVSQRRLAIVFSVVGYIAGAAYCLLAHIGRLETVVFLTYLLSGAFIAVTSKALHFNSSGHACGVAGPIALLVYARGPLWLMGAVVLAAVFRSSLVMKRHTLPQLLAGACSSVAAMVLWLLLL